MSESTQKIKANRVGLLRNSKILFTIISILLGFLVGALVLTFAGYNPIEAYINIFQGVFKSPRNIGWAIVNSTPIILTGLGVCFAFQTGLFNMGAEGQFIVGTIVAFLGGYLLPLPPIILPFVIIILAMIAGSLYGAIAGFVKARFGIHEVISTIMLNRIAYYFQNFIVYRYKRPNSMASFDISNNSKITLVEHASQKFDGFFGQFFKAPIHFGTILALVAVFVVWYILNKTTLGYELKAVGLNREASEYGGIDTKKKIVQSMAISGAICALAGVTQVLGFTYNLSVLSSMQNYGFDGLAVSLLASNNPIGVIFSGLFFGSLNYAGSNLQRVMGVPSELISIIIGTIILFTAVPLVFRITRAKIRQRRDIKNIQIENEAPVIKSEKIEDIEKEVYIDPNKNEKEDIIIEEVDGDLNIINETGEDIKVQKKDDEEMGND